MILAVLASDLQKEEIAASAFFRKHVVHYSENFSLWANHIADAFMDLDFNPSAGRIESLAARTRRPYRRCGTFASCGHCASPSGPRAVQGGVVLPGLLPLLLPPRDDRALEQQRT